MSEPRSGTRRGLRIATLVVALAAVVLGLGWCASRALVDIPPETTADETPIAAANGAEPPLAAPAGDGSGRRPRPHVQRPVTRHPPTPVADTSAPDGVTPEPRPLDVDEGTPQIANPGSQVLLVDGRDGYSAQVVIPPNLSEGASYGARVAIDGGLAAISAPLHETKKGKRGRGRVFVYERRDGAWIRTAILGPPKGFQGIFGRDVAIADGRVIVAVSAPAIDDATVLVYAESEGNWAAAQRLRLEKGRYDALEIAADGDVLVVGTGHDVDVYRRLVHDYVIAQRLPRDTSDALQGSRVAADDDRIAIHSQGGGARRDGAVHVFTRDGPRFARTATIEGRGIKQKVSELGTALALSGTTLVLSGARWSEDLVVMEHDRSGWSVTTQLARKQRPHGAADEEPDLALDGDILAAAPALRGSSRADRPFGFFVARRAGESWASGVIDPRASPKDDAAEWGSGASVAVSGNTVLVGAHGRLGKGRAAFLTLDEDFPGVRAKD